MRKHAWGVAASYFTYLAQFIHQFPLEKSLRVLPLSVRSALPLEATEMIIVTIVENWRTNRVQHRTWDLKHPLAALTTPFVTFSFNFSAFRTQTMNCSPSVFSILFRGRIRCLLRDWAPREKGRARAFVGLIGISTARIKLKVMLYLRAHVSDLPIAQYYGWNVWNVGD